GMLVAKFELNPFIVTLAAMFIFKGLSFLIGRTSKVSSSSIDASFTKFPENFPRIGGGYLFGKVQYINIYMIIILIFLYFLLERNVFFRQNFFIGGNEQAAILAGIKTKLLIILNFALVSTLVAISIILRFSRWQAASANLGGESLGLFVLGAVIIGGGSLKGGVGSIIGTFLGVSLLTIINTGITIIGMDPLFGDIFLAGILMFSILLDKYSKKLILK
ncbi:MAG: hypothetical protein FJW56_10085, partial [Actinobacteria bacterium]|nr:hypothetical protein [Actinomycetota bacterium]